jgi:hypothetical protein
MSEKTLDQRANDLLSETEKRLHAAVHSKDAESPEAKAQIQWLKGRRYEIKNILTFSGETDEELRLVAQRRIHALEDDPWGAGDHSQYVNAKKPETEERP